MSVPRHDETGYRVDPHINTTPPCSFPEAAAAAGHEVPPSDPDAAIDWLLTHADDGLFREFIDGTLMVREPGGALHGSVGINIAVLLDNYVRNNHLGRVLGADVGYILRRNPLTVIAPDASFLTQERWEAIPDRWRFVEGPPDLAVEVWSPSERPKAVAAKTRIYMEVKTPLLWFVDPRSRTVRVWTSGSDQPEELRPGGVLVGDPVIPGFRCQVTDLFE
jgi:Uma2 family endonuclease